MPTIPLHPPSQIGSRICTRAHRLVLAALAALGLCSCEAQYSLDAVEAEARKEFHRTDDLQALAAQGDAVVAVGGQGTVVRSSDRGLTWARETLAGVPALIDVAVCPDASLAVLDFHRAVWIEDDAEDGSWRREPLPGNEIGLALTCDSRGLLWVVGEFSTIWHSTDRGREWTTTTFDRDAIFTAVEFVDAEVGFVAGEFGSFLVSEDGGETWVWRDAVGGDEEEFYPQSAAFRSRDEGWLVGLGGTVFHSTDRGVTWQREASDVDAPLFGIAMHSGGPVAVGGLGTVTRRGSRWRQVALERSIFTTLGAVVSADAAHVIVAGGGGELQRVAISAAETE